MCRRQQCRRAAESLAIRKPLFGMVDAVVDESRRPVENSGHGRHSQIRSFFHVAPRAVAIARTIVPLHGLLEQDLVDVLGADLSAWQSFFAEVQVIDKSVA